MKHSPQQTPFPFACQRWRDHRGIYRPPNEVISTHEYEVAPITVTQAKDFVKRHHYSATYCSVPLSLRSLQTVRTLSRGSISWCRHIFRTHVTESLDKHLHVRPS